MASPVYLLSGGDGSGGDGSDGGGGGDGDGGGGGCRKLYPCITHRRGERSGPRMHAGHSCSAAALTPALALQTVRPVTTLSIFNNVIMSSARRPHRPYLDGWQPGLRPLLLIFKTLRILLQDTRLAVTATIVLWAVVCSGGAGPGFYCEITWPPPPRPRLGCRPETRCRRLVTRWMLGLGMVTH